MNPWFRAFDQDDTPEDEHPVGLALEMLELKVLAMRRQGFSSHTIAVDTGYTESGVNTMLRRANEKILAGIGARDARADAVEKIDRLFELVMPQVVQTRRPGPDDPPEMESTYVDLKYADFALKLIAERRKVLGADVNPAKVLDVNLTVDGKEESTKKLDEFADKIDRFMDFADQIAARGLGSGRQETDITEEARAAGIWTAGQDDVVVDAEIVEPLDLTERPGQWVAGRFIADE